MKLNLKLLALTAFMSMASFSQAQSAACLQTANCTEADSIQLLDKAITDLKQLKADYPEKIMPEYVGKYENALSELKMALDTTSRSAISSRKIKFDYGSIPARIQLAVKIGFIINAAVVELGDKVQSAHNALGFEIFRAVVDLVNPLTNAGAVTKAIDRLDAVLAQAKKAPNMKLDDIANTAKKEGLARLLRKARAAKYNDLVFKSDETYRALNRVIGNATWVRLDAKATLRKVNETVANVKAALATAAQQADLADNSRVRPHVRMALINLVTKARFQRCKSPAAYFELQKTVRKFTLIRFKGRTVGAFKKAFVELKAAMEKAKA